MGVSALPAGSRFFFGGRNSTINAKNPLLPTTAIMQSTLQPKAVSQTFNQVLNQTLKQTLNQIVSQVLSQAVTRPQQEGTQKSQHEDKDNKHVLTTLLELGGLSSFSNLSLFPDLSPLQLESPEHSLILKLIQTAQKSIFIQTQFLCSHAHTHNRVVRTLCERLVKAQQNPLQDPFQCILLTNIDCKQDVENIWRTLGVYPTAVYMEECFGNMGIHKAVTMKNRLFLGHVQTTEVLTYFEGSVVIQDGCKALVTSSSLEDRSLSPKRCSELGILLHDPPLPSSPPSAPASAPASALSSSLEFSPYSMSGKST